MKNATKHADALKALHKRLLKDGKPEPKIPLDPLRALVQGTLSFDASDSRVSDAMASIDSEFVDLNELRVGTELELVQILGPRHPQIEHRVTMLREMLNYIFEKEHTLSFERAKTLGKKDLRTFLRELPEINPYVEAYTMLFGFDAPALPVDEATIALLKDADVVEAGTSIEEAQKFVEAHLKAEESYEFFAVARRAVADKKKAAK